VSPPRLVEAARPSRPAATARPTRRVPPSRARTDDPASASQPTGIPRGRPAGTHQPGATQDGLRAGRRPATSRRPAMAGTRPWLIPGEVTPGWRLTRSRPGGPVPRRRLGAAAAFTETFLPNGPYAPLTPPTRLTSGPVTGRGATATAVAVPSRIRRRVRGTGAAGRSRRAIRRTTGTGPRRPASGPGRPMPARRDCRDAALRPARPPGVAGRAGTSVSLPGTAGWRGTSHSLPGIAGRAGTSVTFAGVPGWPGTNGSLPVPAG
jgi:hypothetical protein